jgi:hypothetical protein
LIVSKGIKFKGKQHRFKKRDRVHIQIRWVAQLASLSVILILNYPRITIKGGKGYEEPGNCFEANLIHSGGSGYLEAAQKRS